MKMPIPKAEVIQIKVLFTEGCINTPRTVSRIEETSRELNIPIRIEKVIISTQEEANTHKFMGSPTVQINGVELDPKMRDNKSYGFT